MPCPHAVECITTLGCDCLDAAFGALFNKELMASFFKGFHMSINMKSLFYKRGQLTY